MSNIIAGLLARLLSFAPWLLPVGVPSADWRLMSDYLWGKPVPQEKLKQALMRIQSIQYGGNR